MISVGTDATYHSRRSSACGSCSCPTGECHAGRSRSGTLGPDAVGWVTFTITPASNTPHYLDDEDDVPTEGHPWPPWVDRLRRRRQRPQERPRARMSLGHPNPHRRLWRAP